MTNQQHTESASTKEQGPSIPMWTLIAAWFCTAVFLFAKLAMYSQSPGAQATPPTRGGRKHPSQPRPIHTRRLGSPQMPMHTINIL